MAHNRAALFYDNVIEDATITATTEATSGSDTMAGENVQTFDSSLVWRSTSAASQTLKAAWTTSQIITAIHFWRHQLTSAATVRARISDNSDLSSPSLDETYYAWPSLSGIDEDGLDMGGLDGAPVTEDLEDFQFYNSIFLDVVMTGTLSSGSSTTTTLPATMTKITGGSEATSRTDDAYNNGILTITGGTGSGQSKRVTDYSGQTKVCTVESAWSTPPDSTSTFTLDLTDYISKTANDGTYTGKYLGITIDDPDNPDLYLQIAWIGAGDYLQPGYDIGRDSQSGVVDNSERTTAADQNLWINQRNRFQVASFTWPHLTEYEAKVRFKIDVGVKAGASSPVVFTPFVENSFRSYTDTIIGYLDAAPMPRQVLQNYTGTSYSCDLSIRGAA